LHRLGAGNSTEHHARTKSIDIRSHFVRNCIENGKTGVYDLRSTKKSEYKFWESMNNCISFDVNPYEFIAPIMSGAPSQCTTALGVKASKFGLQKRVLLIYPNDMISTAQS
jgi:hypothetical protein